MSDEIVKADVVEIERAEESLLTPREQAALDFTLKLQPPVPELSPHLEGKLFQLFLNGCDCVEIARLNSGLTLGQIVRCRVKSYWDMRRQEHVEALERGIQERMKQVALESADFISAQMTAAHKQYGDAAKRYIATGDPTDLPSGFGIHGWKNYRNAIDTLKVVTGQDQKQKISGEVTVKHEVGESVKRAMTAEEARKIIADELKKGKG